MQALDLPRLLPNLETFGSEIDLRLAEMERMLVGQLIGHRFLAEPGEVAQEWTGHEAGQSSIGHYVVSIRSR